MFTVDWHTSKAPVWEKLILPKIGATPVRWLELGSYEGLSAAWTLEHMMPHGGELVCVDHWLTEDIEKRFDENVGRRVTKVKAKAFDYFLEANARGEKFDVAYIDADHDGRACVENAVMCWRLLKIGGILIFDDYRWHHPASQVGNIDPAVGIDAFVAAYALELTLLHRGDQVIVQRRAHVY